MSVSKGLNYEQDLISSIQLQAKMIKEQVLFEVISAVCQCETYEEFRKLMYAQALAFIKDYEAEKSGAKPSEEKK